MNRNSHLTRRRFVQTAGAGVALFTVIPRHVLGDGKQPGANEKINIAGIGIGGQGWSDIQNFGGENIVGLCDVDDQRGAEAFKRWPQAKRYKDFRKMLDEMDSQIDAVLVATPDHVHAAAVKEVLRRKKHVYCEKPLAHSVYEVRELMKAAREAKVVNQLGNQGHSSGSIRSFCEWIWAGAIGKVQEVHACCDAFKNVYCQIDKLPEREKQHDVPAHLDWDLWLGPAAFRSYHPMYCPWNWRGWTPFGTGCIGDWICHVVDPVFWALDLGAPKTIQAEVEGYDPKTMADAYPPGSKITYEFPAKGERGPVKLVWYDGNSRPPQPADLEPGRGVPGNRRRRDRRSWDDHVRFAWSGRSADRAGGENANVPGAGTDHPAGPGTPPGLAAGHPRSTPGRLEFRLRRPAHRIGPVGHDRHLDGRHQARVGRREDAVHQLRRGEQVRQTGIPCRLGAVRVASPRMKHGSNTEGL